MLTVENLLNMFDSYSQRNGGSWIPSLLSFFFPPHFWPAHGIWSSWAKDHISFLANFQKIWNDLISLLKGTSVTQ